MTFCEIEQNMIDLGPWNAPATVAVGSSQARTDLVVASPRCCMVAPKVPSVDQPHRSCHPDENVSLLTVVLGLSPERINQLREVRKDVESKLQTK